RRLAGARGTGDEHHAVWVLHGLHEVRLGTRLDSELLEIQREVALVENSEHDFFAEQRRQGRHTIVDDLVAELQLYAPIRRHATLGDVQQRHDLEARDQRRLQLGRRLHHFHERAVDAVAYAQLVLEALEMNVRRAALHRVGPDRVDHLHYGRVIDRCRKCDRVDLVLVLQQLDVT